jgi:hypothetical protein
MAYIIELTSSYLKIKPPLTRINGVELLQVLMSSIVSLPAKFRLRPELFNYSVFMSTKLFPINALDFIFIFNFIYGWLQFWQLFYWSEKPP